ncbi:hypothetical protein [Acidihalobacter prosperus]|nr:hypothetical protein [Acidihalobacter prosperus]
MSDISIATKNESWGFWGTLKEHAATAWPIALTAISDATAQPLESVRAFLDSRHGRHFADDVQNELYEGKNLADAINATTQRWMGWTIGRQISKQYDIPRGLPCLTGFVIHCEIADEAQTQDNACAPSPRKN